MKLKTNDLQELKKAGIPAITAKLTELRLDLAGETLKLTRGELKDLHSTRITRRAIAQLETIKQQLAK